MNDLALVFGGVMFFVIVTILCLVWVEHDRKRRKEQGLPRRRYGGLLDAEHTSTTITRHSNGGLSVSKTYTFPKDEE